MRGPIKAYLSYTPFRFYIAIGIGLTAYNIWSGAFLKYWVGLVILFFATPFYEYLFHRFLLHCRVSPKRWVYPFFDRSHYGHHRDPNNIDLVFAQPLLVILTLIKIIFLIVIFDQRLDMLIVMINAITFIYLFYEWSHLTFHYEGYTPKTAYGRFIKKRHLWHHFKNENFWWGITSPVADFFLGSLKSPNEVPQSATVKDINHETHP